MSKSNIPFIDADEISFIPTPKEFVEAKKIKKKAQNKIHNSYVEEVVQDCLMREMDYSDIKSRLEEEHGFTVGILTIKAYDELFFQDLEDEALNRVKEKLLHHIDSDKHTLEALYEKKATFIEYLNSSYDRVRTEIEKYQNELEETSEDGSPRLSYQEKMKLIDIIHDREKVLDGTRAKIALALEGPNGSIEKNQILIKEMATFYMKLIVGLCPQEQLDNILEKCNSFIKRYEVQ